MLIFSPHIIVTRYLQKSGDVFTFEIVLSKKHKKTSKKHEYYITLSQQQFIITIIRNSNVFGDREIRLNNKIRKKPF
jgi:hypothetical protein